jgi:hypothetical protein
MKQTFSSFTPKEFLFLAKNPIGKAASKYHSVIPD